MNKNELRDYVKNSPLVIMKESHQYPGLYVLKYKNKVFYNSLWDEFLEECRGMVVDKDFNIISLPFTKIYNYGIESRAPSFDNTEVVDAWRKINGFMAAITWYNNELVISTTGSLDSEFCTMVRKMINVEQYKKVCSQFPDLTFLFECVHINDPHIINEVLGVYLIGYRQKDLALPVKLNNTMMSIFANEFGCKKPEYYQMPFGVLLEYVEKDTHEGYVIYSNSGAVTKIKTPFYLINKFFARKSKIKLEQVLSKNNYKQVVDEEFYPLCEFLIEHLQEFSVLNEQEKLYFIKGYFKNK